MDDGAECTCNEFADDTKLEGVGATPELHTAIELGLDRLEKQADRSLMNFNKEKCKILPLGRKSPVSQYMLQLYLHIYIYTHLHIYICNRLHISFAEKA